MSFYYDLDDVMMFTEFEFSLETWHKGEFDIG